MSNPLNDLVPVLAAGTAILTLAFVSGRFLRAEAAAAKKSFWMITLAVLLLIWPLEVVLPDWKFGLPTNKGEKSATTIAVPTSAVLVTEATELKPLSLPPQVPGINTVELEPVATSTWSVVRIFAVVWLGGFTLLLLRLGIGRIALARLWREGQHASSEWDQLARESASALELHRKVAVRISPAARLPMTWGIRNPRILLPENASKLSEEERRALLLHEMTHIASSDALALVTGQLAVAIHWLNPLAWLALARLRFLQELACDQRVLSLQKGDPADYAGLLVTIA
ncbi:MAG: M56 family metallopeptidase, partial [Verrucomicrobiota bacterium]